MASITAKNSGSFWTGQQADRNPYIQLMERKNHNYFLNV